MTEEQEERLVAAFEQIATALTGIHDTEEKQFGKQWPERKQVREAVYSRVPTAEDRIREEQGASGGSLEEWLTPPDEPIGERERAFLEAEAAARAQVASEGQSEERSVAAPEDQAGTA